jgi:hypothetical protein
MAYIFHLKSSLKVFKTLFEVQVSARKNFFTQKFSEAKRLRESLKTTRGPDG